MGGPNSFSKCEVLQCTDDGSAQSKAVWPVPKFHFQVKWDWLAMSSFQEVSGLEGESRFVTLKRGVFTHDRSFWDWFNAIKMNTLKRKAVVISLIDEAGSPTMVWTLANAWPTKITGTELKAEGNEVVVESIELAYEGLTIASP
jgi:hypothetical protein